MGVSAFRFFAKGLMALSLVAVAGLPLRAQKAVPGSRTVMDAHNCYPYFGQ